METSPMKFRDFAFLAAAAALSASSAAADPTVKVTVVGIKANQGFMMIALHSEKAWSGTPVARMKVAVNGTTMTVTLAAPTPGRYGIKMFQDVDSDGAMSTNIVGFPTEPIGFSNDAPLRFGPPSFADAAFDVGPSGAAQTITLR
jgi:uncharacterized protein (DUF2141 family)